jgi:hypothetical protein
VAHAEVVEAATAAKELLPSTSSQRTSLNCAVEVLEKLQGALAVALRTGNEVSL